MQSCNEPAVNLKSLRRNMEHESDEEIVRPKTKKVVVESSDDEVEIIEPPPAPPVVESPPYMRKHVNEQKKQ
jgi:hypothetical protein